MRRAERTSAALLPLAASPPLCAAGIDRTFKDRESSAYMFRLVARPGVDGPTRMSETAPCHCQLYRRTQS